MTKLTILTAGILALGLGTAQAESAKYTQEEIKQMPRLSSIEQVRCPSAKFTSNKKRLECKEKVRIELYEKQQAKPENAAENKAPDAANNYGGHGHAH